jgi:CubicO group peptidase (beta-lactamase class C family)
MADREQIFPLGKFFSYNNAGFAVLGAILETITETQLEELFKEYIIDLLGQKKMFFHAGEVISYDFAVGHQTNDKGTIVARPWQVPRCVLPMGALVTTVEDLLKYAHCYLNEGKIQDGKKLLEPETILDMFSPKMPINETDKTAVGYSWMRRDLEEGYLVSHGGGTNGQITQLTLLPEKKFALAIFTNSDKGSQLIVDLHKYILKEFIDVAYGLPKPIESNLSNLLTMKAQLSALGLGLILGCWVIIWFVWTKSPSVSPPRKTRRPRHLNHTGLDDVKKTG